VKYHSSPRLSELIRGQLYISMQGIRGRPLSTYIRELVSSERLPPSDFNSLHDERVRSILVYAKEHVPLYQTGRWRRLRSNAEARIDDWPVLEKDTLRAQNNELMAAPKPNRVDNLRTSGTTGAALRIVVDQSAAVRGWAHRYRGLQWHGIPIGVRTLRVAHDRRPLRSALLGQLCVWPPDSTDTIDAALEFLKRKRPTMVAGPPSALFYLARHFRERGVTEPLAPFARVGGEQLFEFQRKQIEATLGSRAIDSYGTTETGAVAGECTAGNLHIYADHLHLEIFDGDTPVQRGEFGDIVVTTLHNKAMPLVRYRVGDKGRISTSACQCGLPHPVLLDLQARSDDIYLATDGRPRHASILVEKLSLVFENTASDGVRAIQFRQIDHAHWEARIDHSNSYRMAEIESSQNDPMRRALEGIVRDTFGAQCKVSIQSAKTLQHTKGKFRYYCRA